MEGPSLMSLSIPGNAEWHAVCDVICCGQTAQDIFYNFMTVKCSEDLWEYLYVN